MTTTSTEPPPRDERRLAAIVSLDVVGYSRLMGRDESGTHAALKAHRRELVDRKIAEHHGRIVKTTGDGLLLEFASVVDAVRCAVDIQRGMAERNADVPEDRRIVLRAGINVGDVIHDQDDIFGDGVNVAARIEALADPGGICVSRAVRDQVLDKLGFAFEDLGAKQVKNIARPVEVYRVAFDAPTGAAVAFDAPPPGMAVAARATSPGRRRWLAAAALVALVAVAVGVGYAVLRDPARVVPYSDQDRRMTFAVLPLDAPTGDADARAAAVSATEELHARQEARPDWARVASRRSVEEAVARHAAIKDIARALDVHYLIRGNVSRAGTGYRAEVQVVDGASERVLGTRSFVFPGGPLPVAQKERIDTAAGFLTFSAIEDEVARARTKPDAALDVRDLTFRAWVSWARNKSQGQEKEAYTQAMALLERARALAPDDRVMLRVVATVNLCDCVEGWSRDVAVQQAIGAKALERYATMNPDGYPTNMLKFQLAVAQGRYEDALLAADAMTRNELEAIDGQASKAYSLLRLGRYDEALAACDVALREREFWTDESLAASIHYALGSDAKAAQHAQKALLSMSADDKRNARFGSVGLVLAAAEARQGRSDRARQALADFHASVPQVATTTQVRAWMHPASDLAGFEPLYDGLRRAGMPN